jgi:hypothetical protein
MRVICQFGAPSSTSSESLLSCSVGGVAAQSDLEMEFKIFASPGRFGLLSGRREGIKLRSNVRNSNEKRTQNFSIPHVQRGALY